MLRWRCSFHLVTNRCCQCHQPPVNFVKLPGFRLGGTMVPFFWDMPKIKLPQRNRENKKYYEILQRHGRKVTRKCKWGRGYNEWPRDWPNTFAITRFPYIEVLFHIYFYYNWGEEYCSLHRGVSYVQVCQIAIPLHSPGFKESRFKTLWFWVLLCLFTMTMYNSWGGRDFFYCMAKGPLLVACKWATQRQNKDIKKEFELITQRKSLCLKTIGIKMTL